MNVTLARRFAPFVFGAVVLIVALFASDALVPVCIIGGIALGAMYLFTRPGPGGRNRNRNRG